MSGDWVRFGAGLGAGLFAWWMAWRNTPELDGVDNVFQYRLMLALGVFFSAMTWLEWWGVIERR